MTFFKDKTTHCPIELSLQIINRKWLIQIIVDMFFGKTHFSEFKEDKPELTNKALSRCLKYMEEEDLITKQVIDEDNSTQYFLTERGRSLNNIIYDLILFTLDDQKNQKYYTKEIIEEAKKEYKEKLNIN